MMTNQFLFCTIFFPHFISGESDTTGYVPKFSFQLHIFRKYLLTNYEIQTIFALALARTMDHIYRTGKYRDALERVRSIRETEQTPWQPEQVIDQYQEEVNRILLGMRSDNDFEMVRVHYVLLFVSLMVVGVLYAISMGVVLIPLYTLLGLVAYIWLAHRLMRTTIAQLATPSISTIELSEQITMAQNGIVIKKRRLLFLSIFYILFFPVLMVFLQYLGMSNVTRISPFFNFLLAFLISGAMWLWYYNLAFDRLDELEEALNLIAEAA